VLRCFVVTLFFCCFSYVSAQESGLRTKLIHIHEDLEAVRNDVYGNCRLEGVESIDKGDSKQVVPFRFWSLENKYFRMDMLSQDGSKVMVRIVLRPDGYVIFKDAGGGLALSERSQDPEKGMLMLYQHQAYLGSTRIFNNLLAETTFADEAGLKGFAKPSDKAKRVARGDSNTNGEFELTMDFSTDTASSRYTTTFSEANRHVLKRFSFQSNNGSALVSEIKASYEYSDQSKVVPIKFSEKSIRERITSSRETKITLVELKPQPIGLFSFEAQGISESFLAGTWIRRLVILGIGVALIGALVCYKLLKK
jgi:hypothetical protein